MTNTTRRVWFQVLEHGCKNAVTSAVWWFLVRPIPLIGMSLVICVAILWMFWLALLLTACISTWLDWRDRDAP